MSTRKSRPRIAHDPVTQLRVIPHVPRPFEGEDATIVDARRVPPPSRSVRSARVDRAPASPTGSRSGAPLPSVLSAGATAAPTNVIPFAKPRAISSLPVEFNPVSSAPAARGPISSAPMPGTSWGSAAVAAATAPARLPQPTPAPMPPAPAAQPTFRAPAAQPTFGAPTALPRTAQPTYAAPPPTAQPAFAAPPQPFAPQARSQPFAQPPNTTPAAPIAPVPSPAVTAPPPVAAAPMTVVTPSRWGIFDRLRDKLRDKLDFSRPGDTSKWAAFERLGLKAPKLDHQKWSGRLVSAYRLLGFLILTIIVIVLVGYLFTTAFFYVSNSWIVPMAISPTDEKVISLQSQLAERQTERDRTAADLDQAERAIAVQQEFQLEFAKAIKSDLQGRKAALERMHELAEVAASTRKKIKRSNSAYATAQQKRMSAEWKAGLIDRDSMLNGKFQIAQISGSNLNLAERQAEYETRAADLDSQTRSLEALLSNEGTEETLSYDVLKIKQEYEASRLETQRAIQNRDMLKAALTREDKLLDILKQSSYLKALADDAHVAFVPYGNLENVKKGEPVYGCWLTMVFCGKVGTVIDVLPGEVQFKHPTRDKMLRGQMVELRLDEDTDATDDVLFVGGRPMLL